MRGPHQILVTLLLISIFSLSLVQPALSSEHTASTVAPERSGTPLPGTITETMQPGLLPYYFDNFFARDVRKLPALNTTHQQGRKGRPILKLNHQFGKGMVFRSGSNTGVGMRMLGAIHLDKPGEYYFQALSNDGFQLYIEDILIVNDPKQHADQLSEIGQIAIREAGWYPLRIEYFQRKGTAALKLYWKTPESREMTIIPESAYAHQPVD